ncbi:UNVERIFIED_CONTAM: precorrin-3B C17-methyltransferase [Acetivibrio alkalicellulosi]
MIYIIGLGPGEQSQLTQKAVTALKNCDVIAGYNVYINLIKDIVSKKQIISTPMKQEVERCRLAAIAASKGKKVAMVSSGDAGIYGMAGLMYEICFELNIDVEIEVIAGITAASSAAAVLGAPLTHDFAAISLSNLLTPWEDIEKRLDLASKAGFVLAIYNPVSKKRANFLRKACEILLNNLDENTMCGYVRNIAREGQEHRILNLKELKDCQIDMFTTVIVGNKNTKVIGNKLVTPRGYKNVGEK